MRMQLDRSSLLSIVVTATCLTGCATEKPDPQVLRYTELQNDGLYTKVAPLHLYNDVPTLNDNGTVNAIIANSAGSAEVWDLDPVSGALQWRHKNDKPVVVQYLGFPVNQAAIPQTASPGREAPTPLKMFLLCPSIAQGVLVHTRVVGGLKVSDSTGTCTYLIGVPSGTALDAIEDLSALEQKMPGARGLLEQWLTHYQGPNTVRLAGQLNRAQSLELLESARASYEQRARAKTKASS